MRNRFESFTASVVTLNRCLQKVKDMEMKRFGLRAAHTMCLYYLGQHEDGLTAAQLTQLCKEDKAAISRSLSLLYEKGFVYSEDNDRKRAHRTKIYLTEEGKRIMSQIAERIEIILTHAGSGLGDDERETFYRAMELIADNLESYMENDEKE